MEKHVGEKSHCLFFILERFVYKHQGHCAEGYVAPTEYHDTIDACFDVCRMDESIGYFAYDDGSGTSPRMCGCYLAAPGCPYDGTNAVNAYTMIKGKFHLPSFNTKVH